MRTLHLSFARGVSHATDRSGNSVNVFCANWVLVSLFGTYRESENFHYKGLLECNELVEFLKQWAEGVHRNL